MTLLCVLWCCIASIALPASATAVLQLMRTCRDALMLLLLCCRTHTSSFCWMSLQSHLAFTELICPLCLTHNCSCRSLQVKYKAIQDTVSIIKSIIQSQEWAHVINTYEVILIDTFPISLHFTHLTVNNT